MRSAPQVTTVTPPSLAAAASHVAATTTSTCLTPKPATDGLASAGSACTTARAQTAASAEAATLGTLHAETVGVSGKISIVTSTYIFSYFAYFL